MPLFPFPAVPGDLFPGTAGMPAGSIIAYAGLVLPLDAGGNYPSSPPSGQNPPALAMEHLGWTLCDGRALEVTVYPQLFRALGYLYGGSGSTFNIPDLRGYFLRGAGGDQNKVDPDAASRKPAPNGTASGPGSVQGCALQSHEHQYTAPLPATEAFQAGGAPAVPGVQTTDTQPPDTGQMTGSPPIDDKVSPNETRPVNIYVHYLIKF